MELTAYFEVEKYLHSYYYKNLKVDDGHKYIFITKERFGFCVWHTVVNYNLYAKIEFSSNFPTLIAIFYGQKACVDATKFVQNYDIKTMTAYKYAGMVDDLDGE